MLSIKDPSITAALILSLLSTLLCIVYGIIYWNKDGKNTRGDRK